MVIPPLAFRRSPLAIVAFVVFLAPASWADTLSYRSGATTPPVTIDVTVQRIEGGELYYTSAATGKIGHKPLDSIVTIRAAGEPALAAAEEAFAAGRWEDAAKGYAKAIDSSGKEWAKGRAGQRLIETGAKTGQFALAARGYVELARVDPAGASPRKPDVPKQPDALKPAIDAVDRSLGGKVSAEAREVLQGFRAELLTAAGRGAEVQRAAAPARPAAPPASPAPSPRLAAAADAALAAANQAMGAKDYDKAVAAIDAAKASFEDPARQAKALLLRAQAMEQSAGTDPLKLQDAAIAYMRAATYADGKEGGAAAGSLFKVADIQERLKNTAEAVQLYTLLATDPKWKGSPVAAAAARKAADLAQAAKGS